MSDEYYENYINYIRNKMEIRRTRIKMAAARGEISEEEAILKLSVVDRQESNILKMIRRQRREEFWRNFTPPQPADSYDSLVDREFNPKIDAILARMFEVPPGSEEYRELLKEYDRLAAERDYWWEQEREIYSSDSSCFIATAVYGTPFCKELSTLRAFRDKKLRKNLFLNILVKLYYKVSPPLANYIRDKTHIKKVVREVIVDPGVRLSKYILKSEF
jgi:hypothetical protein